MTEPGASLDPRKAYELAVQLRAYAGMSARLDQRLFTLLMDAALELESYAAASARGLLIDTTKTTPRPRPWWRRLVCMRGP